MSTDGRSQGERRRSPRRAGAPGTRRSKRARRACAPCTSHSSFELLPKEVMLHIFSLIDSKTLVGSVPLVCREWRNTAQACMEQMRHLSFEGFPLVTSGTVRSVAPACSKVTSLNLFGCHSVDDEAISTVLECCSELRHIRVAQTERVANFLRGAVFVPPALETLCFEDCPNLEQETVDRLLENEALEHLVLRGCVKVVPWIRNERRIASTRLHTVELAGLHLMADETLEDVLSVQHPLRSISIISCNNLRPLCAQRLFSSPSTVERVDVSYSRLLATSDFVFKVFQLCEKLRVFCARGCKRVNDAAFYGSEIIPTLEVLDVRGCRISNHSMLQFAKRFPRMRSLDVGRCSRVTDSGIRSALRNLVSLQHLHFDGTGQVSTASYRSAARRVSIAAHGLSIEEPMYALRRQRVDRVFPQRAGDGRRADLNAARRVPATDTMAPLASSSTQRYVSNHERFSTEMGLAHSYRDVDVSAPSADARECGREQCCSLPSWVEHERRTGERQHRAAAPVSSRAAERQPYWDLSHGLSSSLVSKQVDLLCRKYRADADGRAVWFGDENADVSATGNPLRNEHVERLVDAVANLCLSKGTLSYAVRHFDVFCNIVAIDPSFLDACVVAALVCAVRDVEMRYYPATVLASVCRCRRSVEDVWRLVDDMTAALGDSSARSPYAFLPWLWAKFPGTPETTNGVSFPSACEWFLKASYRAPVFVRYAARVVAAAAVMCALESTQRAKPQWAQVVSSELLFPEDISDLIECKVQLTAFASQYLSHVQQPGSPPEEPAADQRSAHPEPGEAEEMRRD